LILVATGTYATLSFNSYNSRKSQDLRDGYYTAECSNFFHGWKEYLTIYVNNGKIATVEYNAKNASGFIKSWDMNYMRVMNKTDGNYPNKYTRVYAASLLNRQNADEVDAMSGATESHASFQKLANAVIRQARNGDKTVAFVEVSYN
jgi:major membrane immunogen (membrane-anchored lipoprotein)